MTCVFKITMDDRYIDILGMFYSFGGEKGEKRFNICAVCLDSIVGKTLFRNEIPVESFMETMEKFRQRWFLRIVCQGSGIVDEQAMVRLST